MCTIFWPLWDTLEEEELSWETQTLMKTDEQKKGVLNKLTISCWAAFIAIRAACSHGLWAGHPCKHLLDGGQASSLSLSVLICEVGIITAVCTE